MASEIKVDTISENTAGNGVTIDGVLIKDGSIGSAYLDASTTETIQTLTSSSGAIAIDMNSGKAGTITLTENITDIDFTNVPSSGYTEFYLQVTQHASAAKTMSFTKVTVNGGSEAPAKKPSGTTTQVNNTTSSITLYHFKFLNAATPLLEVYEKYENATDGISTTNLVLHVDASDSNSYSGTGSVWADLSGNGNNMTISGATYTTNDGGAFSFDGTDDYAWTANSIIAGNTARTIQFWMKGTAYVDDAPVSLGNTRSANEMFVLSFQSGGTDLNVYGWTSAYDELGMDFGQNTRDGNWHNYAVTWDAGSPGQLKMYVNGVLTDTITRSAGESYSTTSGFTIGANDEGADRQFPGTIGEAAVYNADIGATLILANYNATRSRYGL